MVNRFKKFIFYFYIIIFYFYRGENYMVNWLKRKRFLNNYKLKDSIAEKKNFLTFGIINFLITNIALQIMLIYFETYLATLISQFVNVIIGFFLYGKKVFKTKKFTLISAFFYLILAILLWIFNYQSINFLFQLGINKNLSAILLIPILVSISFFGQKYFVFKNND